MRLQLTLGIGVALALAPIGCGPRSANSASCAKDSDCQRGGVLGRCTSDACSYPSGECDSGWKLENGDCDESQTDGAGDENGETATESAGDEAEADGAGIDPDPDMPDETECGPDVGGCEMLDVLLVVDDSRSSAEDEWQAFITNDLLFDGFLDRLTRGHCDVHIGVISTGEHPAEGCGELGSLRGQERGCWEANAPSFYASGDELDGLRCALDVSPEGDSNEQQVGALLAAVDGEGLGDCNAGFLRTDAKLLVFLFTDEDDDDDSDDPDEDPNRSGTPGDPLAWGTSLMESKMIGQVGIVAVYPRGGCEPFSAQAGIEDGAAGTAEQADNLDQLVDMFDLVGQAERIRPINLCGDTLATEVLATGEFLDGVCNGF